MKTSCKLLVTLSGARVANIKSSLRMNILIENGLVLRNMCAEMQVVMMSTQGICLAVNTSFENGMHVLLRGIIFGQLG